jgi:UDP-N-acetylmuramoyl-tripeptide--D-alanyl-D-alanine ligase
MLRWGMVRKNKTTVTVESNVIQAGTQGERVSVPTAHKLAEMTRAISIATAEGALWQADELAGVLRGTWLVPPTANLNPVRVSYDVSGALRGHLVVAKTPASWGADSADTATKIAEIVRKGAAGIIVEPSQIEKVLKASPEVPVVVVDNTRRALRELALAARRRFGGKVIAVTGTVGKTTSREMLRHVLARQGGAIATACNNNNMPGVERTLACLPSDLGYCVLEMGFGLPLDGLRRSSGIAKPHVALVTYLSTAHLDVFSSQQLASKSPLRLLAEHKRQIFDGLVPGGTAVIRHDIPELQTLRAAAREKADDVWTFGNSSEADAFLEHCRLSTAGSEIQARIRGRSVRYLLRVPGQHMAVNSLGVLLAVMAAGGDLEQACADLPDFAPAAHRLRISAVPWNGGQIRIIDDSFNATPASLASSLDVLALVADECGGRRIAVFRDILHLGPDEVALHVQLAEHVVRTKVDKLFTCGRLMRSLFDAVPTDVQGAHADDLQSLYAAVRNALQPGDVVTVKGGMGHGGLGDLGMRQIVNGLSHELTEIESK